MEWIITGDKTSGNKLRITFNPPNSVLSFLFRSLKTIDFPDYLMLTLSSTGGFGIENTRILFYNQMDLEDKQGLDIDDGDLFIYTYDGAENHTVIKENEFDIIIYNFALNILKINRENHLLPKSWEIKMNESLELFKNKIPKNKREHLNDAKTTIYTFFDGIKPHQFSSTYDDWLSSSDFSILNNSYVKVQDKLIYIMKENSRVLSTFRYYNKEELELTALQYNLKVREENGIYYAFSENRGLRQFQISENDKLAVIYCIEGSNNPESIFIYGVFQK